jgi:leucine-zipper-like transcriptional regulator 1
MYRSAVVYNNAMYIFGGYDGSYKSDLHCFDFGQNRWNAVPAAGRRPRARYRGSLVVHRNWMILYGGHDGTRHLSDAYIFDFHGQAWHSIQTEGQVPMYVFIAGYSSCKMKAHWFSLGNRPRDSHVACVHGQSMFIFGGSRYASVFLSCPLCSQRVCVKTVEAP